jgi:hypothetical protein
MSTRTMKMLGIGIAAIAFLLVTIPVLKSTVEYADSGDHNKCHRDNGDHDHVNPALIEQVALPIGNHTRTSSLTYRKPY